MDLQKSYILENPRVILRPISIEDVEPLADIATREANLWKYTLNKISSKKHMLDYIEQAIADRKNGKTYGFSVYDKNSQMYAGCTRIYDIDAVHNNCAIGYTWYGSTFQGTGLNKNCKYLLLEFAFETLMMERIQFRADKNNLRSINAIKSLGCKEEGVLRSNMYRPDGTRRDSMVLSILRTEWFDTVKTNLSNTIEIHH